MYALRRLSVIVGTSVAVSIGALSMLAGLASASTAPIGQGFRDEFYDFKMDGATYAVNVTTGNLLVKAADLPLAGSSPDLVLRRSYNSLDPQAGPGRMLPYAGRGWRLSVGANLDQLSTDPSRQIYTDWTGYRWGFSAQPDGSFVPDDPFFGTLRKVSAAERTIFEAESGQTLSFNGDGRLTRQQDELGSALIYEYQWVDGRRRLFRVSSSAGTTNFSYTPHLSPTRSAYSAATVPPPPPYSVIRVAGPGGTRTYTHDAGGYLKSYADPGSGRTTRYSYDSAGRLTLVEAPSSTVRVSYVWFEGAYRVSSLSVSDADGSHSIAFTYGPPDTTLCTSGERRMTTVTESGEPPARFCSDSSWNLTASDGPEQTSWFEASDEETEDGVSNPSLGTISEELEGDGPLSAPVAPLAVESCGRNSYKTDNTATFRIKFTRAGRTKAGDRFYQYHINWQVKKAFRSNTRRSWLAVSRYLPNGTFDPSPFDDSDTRRGRGAKWKPWYAHFLRLKVEPNSLLNYQARSQWINPYELPGNRRWVGHFVVGSCETTLR